jgi:hypothetical protein
VLRYGITKTIDVPLEYAYEWLTDFRDDDTKIIGGTYPRHILRRSKDQFVWIQHYDRDGKEKEAVRIVTLKPPNAWHNEAISDEKESVFDYRLTRAGKNRTRLTIRARVTYKTIRPEVKSEMEKNFSADWDKYVSALEKDHSSGKPASG